MTLNTPKTPAFTTATAWSKALTGVGATIAVGNHSWIGIIAAFTPKPRMRAPKRKRIMSAEA